MFEITLPHEKCHEKIGQGCGEIEEKTSNGTRTRLLFRWVFSLG